MTRVVVPGGRIGRVMQQRDGLALVRLSRGRAWYAVRDLAPAKPRQLKSNDEER